MSTAALEMESLGGVEDTLQYRALHTGAVVGFVLALLLLVFTLISAGNSAEACMAVSALNAAPLSICLWSLGRIRREPEVYTGRLLALIGLLLSAICLIGGVGYGGYVYATEVPDGYARISFSRMKPDELQERGGMKIPPEIAAVDGKKIFIKGFIRRDSIKVSQGIDEFLLVRDDQQCCFGDLSSVKFYDRILVEMVGSKRVEYTQNAIKIGGILTILDPKSLPPGPLRNAVASQDDPLYSIKADYAD